MGEKPAQIGEPQLSRGSRHQLDSVIVAEYTSFNVPSDRIVADPEMSEEFAKNVNRQLPTADRCDCRTVNSRLLTLRKLGRLPRLARDYNGRNASRSETALSRRSAT